MTGRAGRAAALAAGLGLALATPTVARADAGPSDTRLVVVGLALAVPTWALGTVIHEGSHVVAAELVGADTVSFRPWPARDKRSGVFQFGLTRVRGLEGDGEKLFFYIAPKLVDVVMLGGYLGLYQTDAYPDGAYGQLVLTELATGFWVDFVKDTFMFSPHNDLVKVMKIVGLRTEWQRLPVRLGFAAASAALGYGVLRGSERMFALNNGATAATPMMLPLVNRRF